MVADAPRNGWPRLPATRTSPSERPQSRTGRRAGAEEGVNSMSENILVSVSEDDFKIILRVAGFELVMTADEGSHVAELLLAAAAASRDMRQGVRQPRRFPGKVER